MSVRVFKTPLFCAIFSFFSISNALTLDQAIDQAIGYDKKYAAAIYEARSAEYLPTIARAALLPKLSITGFQASNDLTQTGADIFGGATTSTQSYTAKSFVGQLTQPLFNLTAIAAYLQSKKQEKAAQDKLAVDFNELKIKVIDAYCGLAAAKEIYLNTEKELETLRKQEAILISKHLAGAASTTEVEEARYAKLLTQASLDDANNGLIQAKIDLEVLTGYVVPNNEPLTTPIINLPQKKSLADLLDIAKESNPKIMQQKSIYESAIYENKKNRAGYLPTVDIVGYQGYQNSNTLSTVGQKSVQGYLGLQLNVPISSGGETFGKERQSAFYEESQRLMVDSVTNDIKASVEKMYSQSLILDEKLKTLKSQILSANYLYLSFHRQREMGLKSTYDLLIVTRRKFQSERDFAKSMFERIATIKKLEVTVGNFGYPQ